MNALFGGTSVYRTYIKGGGVLNALFGGTSVYRTYIKGGVLNALFGGINVFSVYRTYRKLYLGMVFRV